MCRVLTSQVPLLSSLRFDFSDAVQAHSMTRNDPSDSIRRIDIVDRGSSTFNVQVTLVGAIHGQLSPDGERASLIAFECRFMSSRPSRRIMSAQVATRFKAAAGGIGNGDGAPEVLNFTPKLVQLVRDLSKLNLGGCRVSYP